MNESDTLQKFIFEEASIKGAIVHLDQTFQSIMSQHHYPESVKSLLGEALVACLLLTSSIKFEGNMNLQFQGDERLPLLLVQCDHLFNVRAFAKYTPDLDIEEYSTAFLNGRMVITMNQYNQTQMYQSMIPIQSASMSDNLMSYFAQSEQISTKTWISVSAEKAAGILLQLMPEQDTLEREHFWEYAIQIGQTVTAEELFTLDNETLLYKLYHETGIRLFDTQPINFKCNCTENKMKQVLITLGEEESNNLIKEKGLIEITCEFCNQKYAFDLIDITLLFRK